MRDLARTAVVAVADEAPGADVLASPRTAAVPVPVLGRCIAGLSEAIMLRLAERDDLDHVRTTTAQLAQALSALGQVIADPRSASDAGAGAAGPVVLAPPSLLNRAARYLQAARAIIRDEGILPDRFGPARAAQLADTFEADALAMRLQRRRIGETPPGLDAMPLSESRMEHLGGPARQPRQHGRVPLPSRSHFRPSGSPDPGAADGWLEGQSSNHVLAADPMGRSVFSCDRDASATRTHCRG